MYIVLYSCSLFRTKRGVCPSFPFLICFWVFGLSCYILRQVSGFNPKYFSPLIHRKLSTFFFNHFCYVERVRRKTFLFGFSYSKKVEVFFVNSDRAVTSAYI